MAGITNNGVKNSLGSSMMPVGYTIPEITVVDSDPSYTNQLITINKADVVGATELLFFTDLIAKISTAAELIVSTDIDEAVKTVVISSELKSMRTNQIPSEDFYNDSGDPTFICSVDIHTSITE